jgi:hypothetical protein
MNFGNDEKDKSEKTGQKRTKKDGNCGRLPPSAIVCSEYGNPEKWIV